MQEPQKSEKIKKKVSVKWKTDQQKLANMKKNQNDIKSFKTTA